MITEAVLTKYRELGGDLEGLGRWARQQPRDARLEQHLYELDRLLQQVAMVRRGLVDALFAERIRREIEHASVSPEIAAQVWEFGRG
jgi:hypothetical protein